MFAKPGKGMAGREGREVVVRKVVLIIIYI
jgi:hypothetical protein